MTKNLRLVDSYKMAEELTDLQSTTNQKESPAPKIEKVYAVIGFVELLDGGSPENE